MIGFTDISKSFSRVPVLRRVSFTVPEGHTLGLIGENGAGKSTLMNILGGNLRPDEGRMFLRGQPYVPHRPADAVRQGVGFIHQELNLFANLTIAENIFLTSFPTFAPTPFIRRSAMHARTGSLLAEVGLALRPEMPLHRLSAGERQLVEIAKALSLDARLIIFDEPTTSLSLRESETLFALMARLRARGISLIYISHVLNEVLRLSDDIVVLRDGEVVGAGTRAQFTTERMISLMVGRSLKQLYPQRKSRETASAQSADTGPSLVSGAKRAPPVVLEASHLTQPGIVRDVSFTLHGGEVLGLSGLMGAGRSELARILFGLDPCASGETRLNGASISNLSTRRRIQRGLAFLTENRREEGLCMEASIAENIALVSLRRHARSSLRLLDLSGLRKAVGTIRAAVRLTATVGDQQPVQTLSGGNQQKVVLAKWLLATPGVLLLDEPTRGIDVGAKYEVYQLINELADQGTGVLMISSELEELIGLCDRILVMSRGEIQDELARTEFDRERILRAALGDSRPHPTEPKK